MGQVSHARILEDPIVDGKYWWLQYISPINANFQFSFCFFLFTILYRDPSQTSSAVQLEKGKVYYMEALMKEGGGGDHIAVGVKLPSGTLQRPISQEDIYIRPPPGMMQAHLM